MMNRKSVESLKRSEVFTRTELTPKEYLNELLQYQRMMGNIVFDDEEEHRMDEIIGTLEKLAKDRGFQMNPEFRKGMQALRAVGKEIAISMSGRNAEDRVEKTLEYVSRPNYRFRNVYVSDEEQETELDNVILTDLGLIILEIKNIKNDITISEEGRLLHDNKICYHNDSVCEKMQRKRRLLRKELEKQITERGLDIPVRIDSFIVFSYPKYMHPTITDHCGQEKYCSRGKLPFLINALTSNELYSEAEMASLKAIMEEMATQQKRFQVELDFNQIRADIIDSLELFVEKKNEKVTEQQTIAKKPATEKIIDIRIINQKRRRAAFIGTVASFTFITALAGMMTGSVIRSIW